jgi:prepilin-type processing-associated H-X9-DG protein
LIDPWGGSTYPVGKRHSNGCNVAFVDGHVEWYPTSVVENSSWWDRQ